jgi:uncharacterized protein (DUF1684 family)
MKPGLLGTVLAALALLAACGGDPANDAYRHDIDAWHAERIERLRAPDGWLTLVGLHALEEGENTVGTGEKSDVRLNAYAEPDLGIIRVTENAVQYLPVEGGNLKVDGRPADPPGPVPMVTDAEGEPTVVATGTVSFYVIERGGKPFLRVKDSANEIRREFEGIERYAVDPRWRVSARLDTTDVPPTVPITDILGNVEQEPSPGVLVFELEGHRHRLIPVGEPGQPLFIVFGDATNGKATYGGGRFLSADPPDSDGTVVLDFNKAINPPCVFTPYATCPLPPRENVLPLAVTAGEKVWGKH